MSLAENQGAAELLKHPPPDGSALRRRRADKEHDLFATIVEDAFSEIIVFDAETLAIILANKSARNNLGYTGAEVSALLITDLKSEFSACQLREIYQPILDGKTTRMVVHTTHRRKNGTSYPVEVHSRLSKFESRPVICQIVIDQTDIRNAQAHAELASSIERDAAEARGPKAFLASLLERLSRQFGSEIAHAYMWSDRESRLESSKIWSPTAPASWQAGFRKATEAMTPPSGMDLPGQVHGRRQPIIMGNLCDNPAFARGSAFSGMPNAMGFAMPIFVSQKVAVVLEFFSSGRLSVQVWPELTETLGEQISRLYERMCAEESVNESRERFDAAVNGAAVGLWDYNYKNQGFYLSPRCREILHMEPSAPPASWKDFGSRIHPKDIRRTAAAMKAHMVKRVPYDVEYRYRVGADDYIWLRSRARGVWDGDGNIVRTAGIIEDISAEKEGENVQREVLACIAASDDVATKVARALDRVCRYLGLETALVSRVENDGLEVRYRSSSGAGPLVGTSIPLSDTICSDVYPTDALQAFPSLANTPVAAHPARSRLGIEAYIGVTVFVKGLRFGTLSFFSPRTRKAFDESEVAMVRLLGRWVGEEIGRASDVAELRESDVRKSAKLASVVDALLTVDDKGRIEDVNPAAARMFLWSPEELRLMSIGALLPTAKAFSHADGRLIPVNLRQDVAVRRDGHRLAVMLKISEIHLATRTTYVVAISDLTEVKQAETAKGEFISVVSHELRTPLTSIRGALDLIVSQITGPLAPETARLAEVAQRNCDRLLRLVNDILAIEKLESGQFEMQLHPLDLGGVLADSVAANALYAAKFGAAFDLSVAEGLPMVVADAERLVQVMANLLSNAAKFTRPGTGIFVKAEPAGRFVKISVRDQGMGVPRAIQGRIFEKFTQGESANTRGCEGSGLGLSIARQMVELMNGEIAFESHDGIGTTFTVKLPAAELCREAAMAPGLDEAAENRKG